ncbi:MAG: aldo/keto reductase [Woeseiaceae bacterium]|nr:aldo/keto reductase [Woeseiaceae bacterium]
MRTRNLLTRRELLQLGAALGLAPALAGAAGPDTAMRTRPVPASGEPLPVVGLGTYEVFDVGGSPAEIAARLAIVEQLVERGGSVIDTSPMYDRSERVIGEVLERGGLRDGTFLATKVWTDGAAAGEAQMAKSADLMNADVIDLMQVHNLRDTATHMATIADWQSAGRIRYNGITHYRADALDDMEAAMRRFDPQFIQINYSLGEREADERLLPLAADTGTAVLINRPYVTGRLFRAVRGRSLPDWAGEFAASWGQFFLKYILGHPAVTCVIPATSDPQHMADNLGAGFGPLPDAATRRRMEALVDDL